MGRGIENYEGKEICILGGGDGALLYELLKENPKHVVMLEIDELVMQACNKYLSSICGDVLEKRKTDQYEIIVGDCVDYMKKFIAEGRKFDYVFGDLTDIPISGAPIGECWDFIRTIFEHSFKLLKPDGKFLTHGNGTSCLESLQLFEDQLRLLKPKVKFTTTKAFVPSFMEEWLFYQVTFAWPAQDNQLTRRQEQQQELDKQATQLEPALSANSTTATATTCTSCLPNATSIAQLVHHSNNNNTQLELNNTLEMLNLHSYTVILHSAKPEEEQPKQPKNLQQRRRKKRVHYHHALVS